MLLPFLADKYFEQLSASYKQFDGKVWAALIEWKFLSNFNLGKNVEK